MYRLNSLFRSAVEQVPTKDYECPLGKVRKSFIFAFLRVLEAELFLRQMYWLREEMLL